MSIQFVAKLAACFALASLMTGLSVAQQPTTQTDSTSSTSAQTQEDKKKDEKKDASQEAGQPPVGKTGVQNGGGTGSGTSRDRLFYTLPNFLTLESRKQLPPLTAKQKYAVVARGAFDYVQIPWYGFLSGISQAEDSEPGLGQGSAGYGKRFATAFADGTIENFVTGAVLPSLLHADPRFYQLGSGSFGHRAWYAVSRNLITLTDSGKKQFNYSEVVGGAFSAAFSTYTYHPKSHIFSTPTGPRFVPSDRTLTNTAKVWGTQYAYDSLTLVVREFWPDIHRALSHKYRRESAAASQ